MKGIKPMSAYSEAASGFVVSGELQSLLVSLDAEARARIVGQAYLIATCDGCDKLDNPTEHAVAVMVATKAVEIRNSFRKRQEQSRGARKSHDSRETISRLSRDGLEMNEESKGSPLPLPNKEESKETITPKPPRKVFVPPKVEEVEAYCAERKNGINASDFVDFYTGKGWMIGKNKMVDWKAAVRTWERNRSNALNRLSDGQGTGVPSTGHRFHTVEGNFRGGTDARRTEASAVL